MERFDISYSKKNIAIPSEKEYITYYISKVESVTKGMRFKSFGFKSPKCPPAIDKLGPFESNLQRMRSNKNIKKISKTLRKQKNS